jgi:hypothetical protein
VHCGTIQQTPYFIHLLVCQNYDRYTRDFSIWVKCKLSASCADEVSGSTLYRFEWYICCTILNNDFHAVWCSCFLFMEYSWRVFHMIDREKFLIFLWSAFYRLSLLMMKHQEDWKCWPCMANRFIHWHAEYRLSLEATSFSWSATSETQDVHYCIYKIATGLHLEPDESTLLPYILLRHVRIMLSVAGSLYSCHTVQLKLCMHCSSLQYCMLHVLPISFTVIWSP